MINALISLDSDNAHISHSLSSFKRQPATTKGWHGNFFILVLGSPR